MGTWRRRVGWSVLGTLVAAAVALAFGFTGEDSARELSLATGAESRVQSERGPAPVDLEAAREIGRFRLRHYWIHTLPDVDRGYPIYDRSCRVLARVPGVVRRAVRREGTARLADGSLINLSGSCRCGRFPCFFRVDPTRPWGMGVRGHHLVPFRTIAVDPRFVRIGTRVYIAELDGVLMPGEPPFGGFVHDGCVVAADRGRGIRGNKIDFFVADRSHFVELMRELGLRRVHLYRGVERCRDRTPLWTPAGLDMLRRGLERARAVITGEASSER